MSGALASKRSLTTTPLPTRDAAAVEEVHGWRVFVHHYNGSRCGYAYLVRCTLQLYPDIQYVPNNLLIRPQSEHLMGLGGFSTNLLPTNV
jgi:hypothetical protein